MYLPKVLATEDEESVIISATLMPLDITKSRPYNYQRALPNLFKRHIAITYTYIPNTYLL